MDETLGARAAALREYLVQEGITRKTSEAFISEKHGLSAPSFAVLLDNATVHKAKASVGVAHALGINFLFLPPYCPELAPVELSFKAVKAYTREALQGDRIDFEKRDGFELVGRATRHLTRRYNQNAWKSAIKHCVAAIKDGWKMKLMESIREETE